MKNKTFITLVVILIVLILGVTFWGLTRKDPPGQAQTLASLKQPFDAKATIKMKDVVLEADLNRSNESALSLKVLEPKGLKDMEFSYDGKDIKIAYKGLGVKLDDNSRLVSSMMEIIINSINKASSGSGIDVKVEGENLHVSGSTESGNFSMILNKKTGAVISLSVPELDFECNLRDFN